MAEYQSYSQFNTRLIIVEGYTEKLIINYLRKRFETPLIFITPIDSKGGTPHVMISYAIKFSKHQDFQKKYIYIDTDKKIKKEDLELAKKNEFEFIFNNKCGEATILQLVKPNKDWTKSTRQCKHFFGKIIGPKENICKYLDNMSDSKLKNHPTICQLINIIQKR